MEKIAHKEAYNLWSRLEAEFDRYYDAVGFIPDGNLRLQEDLRRYLCLRCAGFLEKVTFECIIRFLEESSGGPALQFSKSFFKNSPNLNFNSMKKLIGRFGEEYEARFESFMTQLRRDSLNDLAALRNPIAHGDLAGGRKLDPERYYKLSKDIYEWLTGELLSGVGESHSFSRPDA
ncbi:HEPN domain-containing protein [Nesterenkonia populi]